jgi:hypothetical protein
MFLQNKENLSHNVNSAFAKYGPQKYVNGISSEKEKSKKNHNVQRKIITETCLIMYKEKAYRKGGCHWHPMLCHLKHQFPGMQ